MNKKIFCTYFLILTSLLGMAQTKKIEDPTVALYKMLTKENINIKDSLIIYALNFELSISKKDKGTKVTHVAANDSLAFKLFPSHKNFNAIDFSPIMTNKNKIILIVPILIYGSSPEKMIYKDKNGNALISLSAAVNAAYALYSPLKYNNQKDAEEYLGHLVYKAAENKKPQLAHREVILMAPITIEIKRIQ